MLGLPKVIAKFNPIQISVMKSVSIIKHFYEKLTKEFRYRCNYRELKVSDLIILACMLTRIDLYESSESHFHQMLVASGIVIPERSRYNRRCCQLKGAEKLIRLWMLNEFVH